MNKEKIVGKIKRAEESIKYLMDRKMFLHLYIKVLRGDAIFESDRQLNDWIAEEMWNLIYLVDARIRINKRELEKLKKKLKKIQPEKEGATIIEREVPFEVILGGVDDEK